MTGGALQTVFRDLCGHACGVAYFMAGDPEYRQLLVTPTLTPTRATIDNQ
jgi:hypothetical protein